LATGAAGAAEIAYTWKPLRIGAGGFVTGININPDSTRYIRTDTYGAYRWDEATSTWTQLVSATSMPAASVAPKEMRGTYSIQSAPTDSTLVYMVWWGQVYKSTNSGGTWTHMTDFARQTDMDANGKGRTWSKRIAINPTDGSRVLVGTTSDGIYYTSDGGTNFTKATGFPDCPSCTRYTQTSVTGLCWDTATAGIAYAMANTDGAFQSTDYGATWSRISDGVGDPDTAYGADCWQGVYLVAHKVPSEVWEYDGASWSTLIASESGGKFNAVAGDPRVADRILAVMHGGQAYVSRDAGDTWDAKANARVATTAIPWADFEWAIARPDLSETPWAPIAEVAFDPTGPDGFVLAAEGVGVRTVTLPAGALGSTVTWTEIGQGIEQIVARIVLAPPGESIVHLCGWDRSTFSRTRSELDTYADAYGPLGTKTNIDIHHCWGLAYVATDPTNPKLVQRNAGGNEDVSGTSTNKGTSWTEFTTDLNLNSGGSIAASTDSNFIITLPGVLGTYYTLDAGVNWTQITGYFGNSPITSHSFNRHTITCDHVTPLLCWIYYISRNDGADDEDVGVWKTIDGGVTWTLVYSGYVTNWSGTSKLNKAMDVFNGKLKSVPGHSGHLYWTTGYIGRAFQTPDPDTHAWFSRSTDGGATWSQVNTNVKEVHAMGFGDELPAGYPRLFIAGYVSGTFGIWRSDDNGTS